MKIIITLFVVIFFSTTISFAQTGTTIQNASQAKDAPVNVLITDFKKNPLRHELVVFRSLINSKEYQGLSQDDGKFSLRLPAGDKYEIFVLGFKDSTSLNMLEIPALGANASYKVPFDVELQHQSAKTFILEGVVFETNKADLDPDSYPVLDELVVYLNRNDDERIEIGGHTDNVGKAPANLLLSMERAKSVMAYLLTKGIATTRLTAKGYGMTMPIASNKTEEGKAENRRTEVKILD
jgi:outer membrane protein OmpA-like peptidoglycan-associated protein